MMNSVCICKKSRRNKTSSFFYCFPSFVLHQTTNPELLWLTSVHWEVTGVDLLPPVLLLFKDIHESTWKHKIMGCFLHGGLSRRARWDPAAARVDEIWQKTTTGTFVGTQHLHLHLNSSNPGIKELETASTRTRFIHTVHKHSAVISTPGPWAAMSCRKFLCLKNVAQ